MRARNGGEVTHGGLDGGDPEPVGGREAGARLPARAARLDAVHEWPFDASSLRQIVLMHMGKPPEPLRERA